MNESAGQIYFDKNCARFSCRVFLNKSANYNYIEMPVNVRLEYQNMCHMNIEHIKVYNKKDLLASEQPTHVILTMDTASIPELYEATIPGGELIFSTDSISYLLKEEKTLDSIMIEALEDKNSQSLEDFVSRLVGLIRLENSDVGMQYSVIGSFSEPEITRVPWEEEFESWVESLYP